MMEHILELQNVSKTYYTNRLFSAKDSNGIRVLDHIEFSIQSGKTLGLVGESGCGKTTTTKLILLLEEISDGTILFNGEDITKLSGQSLYSYRKQVQAVFQDPYSSLDPRMTVFQIISEPMITLCNYNKKQRNDEVRKLIKRVGLSEDHLFRYPHEFSGGQRQRIAIARALATEPALLILDEPVSALDASIRGQILNLFRELQQDRGVSYLFISHDLDSVAFISDTIAVMYFGAIVEYGSTEDIMRGYRHPYTQKLLLSNRIQELELNDSENLTEEDIPSYLNRPQGCPFCHRCPYQQPICHIQKPELSEIDTGHWVACHMCNSVQLHEN